jgi:hypothetical protein
MELTNEDIRLIGMLAGLGFDPVEFLTTDDMTQGQILTELVAQSLHLTTDLVLETGFLKMVLTSFKATQTAQTPILEEADLIPSTATGLEKKVMNDSATPLGVASVKTAEKIFFFTGH